MQRAELLSEFPELARLTESELDQFLHAFGACRARASVGIGVGSLVLGTLVFVPLGIIGLVIAASPGPSFSSSGALADFLWAVGGLMVAGAVTLVVVRRYMKRMQFSMFTSLLRYSSECAGCGYELTQLESISVRPGVVRCPECGLINPARPGMLPA